MADKTRGLPIGNLSSQFFANVYLNELDQFVKHELKCRYYLRYVDDFILLATDYQQLSRWKEQIEEFLLKRLKLELNPKYGQIKPVTNGVDYLGYISRKDYQLVRNSYLGHFAKADSYRLQQTVIP